MSSSNEIPTLLRFLTQEAKMPLAMAMGAVKGLQTANLTSPEAISKSDIPSLRAIFATEKSAKLVLNASRRVSKKRLSSVSTDSASPASKRTRRQPQAEQPETPEALEASLELPDTCADEKAIRDAVLVTNRAPLVLAFAVTLLKYTMPEQPLSSRLSLVQAVVSMNSRSKAVRIGLESGKSAEEEGYGDGQPAVKVMGREIRVMKRWGYEWKSHGGLKVEDGKSPDAESADAVKAEKQEQDAPALWGLDLEALKRSNEPTHNAASSSNSLPIYTPQSARAYLLKSFSSAHPPKQDQVKTPKKQAAASAVAEEEGNLGLLLGALDLLFQSWAPILSPTDLDKRAWSWYVSVRPDVESGTAGWGGKNEVKLSAILDLRRKSG
ncbi:hypothetical protein K490DRAFT_43555 [Saccharata proteae CBS 121410]|uniref:Impact N-terminal domain-containing protein n=1 Tax=Saccharata proteae CBS 121410 TaxID=1314787 RepID=A0A9P4HRQ8_9PEZI|nr:hypothetical protein K490DRAFT_43555 [Saccharata proteae CBS 121410]